MGQEDSSKSSKDEECFKKKGVKNKEKDSKFASTAMVPKDGSYISFEGYITFFTLESRTWHMDTSATSHMTHCRDWYSNFFDHLGEITIGDNCAVPVQRVGTILVFGTSTDRGYFSSDFYVLDLGFKVE